MAGDIEDVDGLVREEFRKLLRSDYTGDLDTVPLAELGIDSLDFFETIMNLEDEHGITVPMDELDSDLTLADLLAVVKKS